MTYRTRALAARTHALGVGRMFRQLGPLIGDSLATLEGPPTCCAAA
ncbi:hypothetical protein [Nonomuraea sp. NPDC003709]